MLDLVDSNKLLALKTSDIKQKLPSICQFLNIDRGSVNIQSSHSFKAPKKYNLLTQINPDYIEQLIHEAGGKEIMKDFYPEISSVNDVRL
mgnify:FL=1